MCLRLHSELFFFFTQLPTTYLHRKQLYTNNNKRQQFSTFLLKQHLSTQILGLPAGQNVEKYFFLQKNFASTNSYQNTLGTKYVSDDIGDLLYKVWSNANISRPGYIYQLGLIQGFASWAEQFPEEVYHKTEGWWTCQWLLSSYKNCGKRRLTHL